MVLESLLNPLNAKKKPYEMFVLGMIYAGVSAFLSIWIFRQQASLVMVFLTVLASMPLLYGVFKDEEAKEKKIKREMSLLREHSKTLFLLMLFFMGITCAFSLLYIFGPQATVESLFKVQTQTIFEINNRVTGQLSSDLGIFSNIFLNNLKVLVFCVLFAFVYGVGAIFILTWNATVIGVSLGNFIRVRLAESSNYFHIASLGILRYMIHGIPEIMAYFVAGIAGAIISVAVINNDYKTESFSKIVLDTSDLLMISIGLLFIAALLEVFVTPNIMAIIPGL